MNTTIKLSLLTTLLLNANLFAEEKLEDITVTTATKTTQNINDVTSNINVITAQEIEERGYTTVAQALNSLPGVSYTSNGGLGKSTSIRIRGLDTKRVLVLIDGIRYNDVTGFSGAPFAHLMATDIERIEVIKGAQSGIWGADAAAGVINIITKSAKDGLHFSVAQEFGSFNSSTSNLDASYKNDDFFFKINRTFVESDGFTAYATRGVDIDSFEDDSYRNKTTNIKGGFSFNTNNKVTLTHTVIDAQNNLDNSTSDSLVNHDTTEDEFSSIQFNHVENNNEVKVYANRSTFKRQYSSSFGDYPYEGNIKEYGLNAKASYLDNSFLLVGGDYKKFEQTVAFNNNYTNKALFLTNHNKIKNSFGTTILTESIRDDQYSAFKNKTTGKVGIKHNFNIEGLTTSANYGTAYNVPTLNNLFGPFGANPNLIPEELTSYDLTIAYKDFSATYFNSTVDNLIVYDFVTGYNNVSGKSKIKGYELAYNTTLNDDIATNVSYTKTDAKDSAGFDLERRADESIKFGVDYYGVENLHLGLNGEYVGDRIQYAYGTHTVNAHTGNYTVANFTTNYNWNKHLSFYGKVDNITDKYYQTVEGYATSPRAFYGGMKLTY